MKKALLVFMALVVPFFTQAESIFLNADTHLPDTENCERWKYDRSIYVGYSCGFSTSAAAAVGREYIAKTAYPSVTGCSGSIQIDSPNSKIITVSCRRYDDIQKTYVGVDTTVSANLMGDTTIKRCPPATKPEYSFGVYFDEASTDFDACANPNTIPTYDTCNINDTPNVQVTDANACYTKADGSQCAVTAVDIGGGNQVYMGVEGNCYSDPQPDVTDNNPLGEPNPDGSCSNNGGLLACSEDPTNVCGDSGSNYGGGSVNNCQSGCGYVNDSFVCYDLDTDSDGLPDYNDPDIDGDGIANDEDIDADGDGQDDPIYGNNSGGGGGGSVSVDIDLTPVVAELKKLNKNFEKDNAFPEFGSDNQLEDLNNDYQTQLEDFIAKGSEELGYVDELVLGNEAALSVLPSNDCSPYTLNIGGSSRTFDICPAAEKAKPILAWLVGMLTAWHIFVLINLTLREGI